MNTIHVIDVQGNILHDTYARRAKGLVKKGRAYYVDDTSICMICPDGKGHTMETMTKEELLNNMEKMLKNSSYIKEAMDAIEKIPYDLDEEQVKLRTEAITQIVKEKEATNQGLVELWKMMAKPEEDTQDTIEE